MGAVICTESVSDVKALRLSKSWLFAVRPFGKEEASAVVRRKGAIDLFSAKRCIVCVKRICDVARCNTSASRIARKHDPAKGIVKRSREVKRVSSIVSPVLKIV